MGMMVGPPDDADVVVLEEVVVLKEVVVVLVVVALVVVVVMVVLVGTELEVVDVVVELLAVPGRHWE